MTVSAILVLLVLGALLASLPLVARRRATRAHPCPPDKPHRAASPAFYPAALSAPRVRPAAALLREADRQSAGVRPEASPLPPDPAPADDPGDDFDYTIKRHPAAQPQQVADQGGFAEAPILLYAPHGACILTHRTLFLN